MKKAIAAVALTVLCLVTAMAQQQQVTEDRGSAELALGGGKVTVEYGRPSLNGRDIAKMMNEQLPVGTPWRMGSGNATTLTTDTDLKFGNTTVAKGKYSLQAKRLDEKNWVMILSGENDAKSEVPLKFKTASSSAEKLTVTLSKKGSNGGDFLLQWGTFTLSTEFKKA
jgi:DUF2911 family protein